MQEEKNIESLIFRYLQGEATAQEEKVIEEWVNQDSANKQVYDRLRSELFLKKDLSDLFKLVDGKKGTARIQRMRKQVMDQTNIATRGLVWRSWMSYAAACVIILIGFSVFFIRLERTEEEKDRSAAITKANPIQPGKNKAIMILDNGDAIELRNDEAGVKVVNGTAVYSNGENIGPANEKNSSIIVKTPRGGQYVVQLPDGTKVYLNSESSLKYPNYFFGSKRTVELKGEAYFEVVKSDIPFMVKSRDQELEVLGTSFNLSAYDDLNYIQTTLVEGKVKIKYQGKYDVLTPGLQLTTSAQDRQIARVDTDIYTAWKDGAFSFSDESLESIMKRASRWYDVDIIYSDDKLKSMRFEGYVSKFSEMQTLLQTLRLAGEVDFKISERKVYVLHKK